MADGCARAQKVFGWKDVLLPNLVGQYWIDDYEFQFLELVLSNCWVSQNWIAIQEQSKIRFRFFDNAVPIGIKKKKVVALKNRDATLELSKRFPAHSVNPQENATRGLNEFLTKSTQMFFDQHETTSLKEELRWSMTKNEDQIQFLL